MNTFVNVIIFCILLFAVLAGIIHNWMLRREVYRTRPLNVTAPQVVFSIFRFNIAVLGVTLFIIILALLFLFATR